ncbi:MAG: hypothetical protein JW958_00045 [Candidatus Eisenbacteria bacterium]|nr:hypothetical protein [Candidatus Eisenbacteria bacterium]
MKECEWCGDDFRGKGEELEGHFFCSIDCLQEWKKDVHGSAEVTSPKTPGAEGED